MEQSVRDSRAAATRASLALPVETIRSDMSILRPLLAAASQRKAGDPRPVVERARNPVPPRAATIGEPGGACSTRDVHAAAADGVYIPVRWYEPEGVLVGPPIVYVHGGGWVSGDLGMLDTFGRQLAVRTRLPVAFIEYRLAPECPYPVPLEDTLAGIRGILAHQPEDCPILLVGDSAGANLAMHALGQLTYSEADRIAGLVAIYPAMDPAMAGHSHREHTAAPTLDADTMRAFWDAYLPQKHRGGYDPLPRDLAATGRHPRTLIALAGVDPLRDDGLAYGRFLQEAGAEVECVDYADCPHGFLWMAGLMDEGRDLMERIAGFAQRME